MHFCKVTVPYERGCESQTLVGRIDDEKSEYKAEGKGQMWRRKKEKARRSKTAQERKVQVVVFLNRCN